MSKPSVTRFNFAYYVLLTASGKLKFPIDISKHRVATFIFCVKLFLGVGVYDSCFRFEKILHYSSRLTVE